MPAVWFEAHGATAKLWRLIERWTVSYEADPINGGWDDRVESNEILLDGPAGTGKSRGALELVNYIQWEYPGTRGAFARRIRADVNTSIAVEFEGNVLGSGSPVLQDGATTRGRRGYRYPNGSFIDFMGFDDEERWKSTEFDWVYVNEGTELDESHWQIATSRARRWHLKWGQPCIVDCNPSFPRHWLNRRPHRQQPKYGYPQMHRLTSIHKDNPKFYDRKQQKWTREGRAYVDANLQGLTGHRRERLLLGKWAAQEGIIYEDFDPSVHIVERLPASDSGSVFKYVVVGVDWGFRHPGVLAVYGIDYDGRAWLISETYQTQQTPEFWTERAKAINKTWSPVAFVCPPDRPDNIERFRAAGIPCVAAYTDIIVGLGLVRERLQKAGDGRPRIYFYRHALDSRDMARHATGKPCSTIEEFDEYVYPKDEEEKVVKEKPDPLCPDHGMDTLRYVVCYLDREQVSDDGKKPYDDGTYGQMFVDRSDDGFERSGWSRE